MNWARPLDRQAIELGLGLVANFVRRHLLEPWQPVYVQPRHARLPRIAEHLRAFGANGLFNQERNAICLDGRTLAAAMELRLRHSDKLVARKVLIHWSRYQEIC